KFKFDISESTATPLAVGDKFVATVQTIAKVLHVKMQQLKRLRNHNQRNQQQRLTVLTEAAQ
ncbi:hypothetical protein Q7395_09375, partial [Glaesserella parasuis]|nr:hypothetical protein [Glaesserella parasuis]MDP0167623.1 hypothetical protein [Glaesserella parasuis]